MNAEGSSVKTNNWMECSLSALLLVCSDAN